MKIAFLLNSISRTAGGVYEVCRRLGQTLAVRNEVEVLGIRDEFTNADLASWAPLQPRVFASTLPGNFGVAKGYAEELQRLNPALVHVHALWIYPSLAGYRWHRRTKRPLIYTAHGMLDPWAVQNSGWKKRLVRAGAFAALMTGSGSAVFGLFSERNSINRAMQTLRGEKVYRISLVGRARYRSLKARTTD